MNISPKIWFHLPADSGKDFDVTGDAAAAAAIDSDGAAPLNLLFCWVAVILRTQWIPSKLAISKQAWLIFWFIDSNNFCRAIEKIICDLSQWSVVTQCDTFLLHFSQSRIESRNGIVVHSTDTKCGAWTLECDLKTPPFASFLFL